MTPDELRQALRIPEGASFQRLFESLCPAEGASRGYAARAVVLDPSSFGLLNEVPEVAGLRIARHTEDPRLVLVEAAALPADEDGAVGSVRFDDDGEVHLDARVSTAALRLVLEGRVIWVVNDAGNIEVLGLDVLPFEARRPIVAPTASALAPPNPRAILDGLAIQDSILARIEVLAAQSDLHAVAALGLALRAWRPPAPQQQLAALLAGKPVAGVAQRVDAWLDTLDAETLGAWAAWSSGFTEAWLERALSGAPEAEPGLLDDRDTCESLHALLGRRLPADQIGDCGAGDAALFGHPSLAWDQAAGDLAWLDEVFALDPDAWWSAPEWRP